MSITDYALLEEKRPTLPLSDAEEGSRVSSFTGSFVDSFTGVRRRSSTIPAGAIYSSRVMADDHIPSGDGAEREGVSVWSCAFGVVPSQNASVIVT